MATGVILNTRPSTGIGTESGSPTVPCVSKVKTGHSRCGFRDRLAHIYNINTVPTSSDTNHYGTVATLRTKSKLCAESKLSSLYNGFSYTNQTER